MIIMNICLMNYVYVFIIGSFYTDINLCTSLLGVFWLDICREVMCGQSFFSYCESYLLSKLDQ